MAKFVGNNTESETTKVTPFFANKGFHPRMGIEPIDNRPRRPTNVNEANANDFASQMQEFQEVLQNQMLLAQANHKQYTNQRCGTAPSYKESNMVWLDTRNLVTKRPCQKLENRRAGPYKMKKIVSTHAIELELPEDIRIHPVFHVNLLEPTATDPPHPGHIQPPPLPIEIDGETEWEVEAIVDSQYFGRSKKLQYRVR